MSTRVDVEEMGTTRSEKLLTVVLSVFMLIGGLWAYHNVDDIGRPSRAHVGGGISPAERAAEVRHDAALQELRDAEGQRKSALQKLELRREAYRTALEAARSRHCRPGANPCPTWGLPTATPRPASETRAMRWSRPVPQSKQRRRQPVRRGARA